MWFRSVNQTLLIALIIFVSGCSVPNHMHVVEGISPKNIDTNVRFRTTYYFRVFDYCWQVNPTVDGHPYRQIVPETDVMYRYRMTGKASALGSKIKFESGTLPEAVINQFGSDAVYHDEINGYVVRSQSEALSDLRSAQQQKAASEQTHAALAKFKELSVLHEVTSKKAVSEPGNQALIDRRDKLAQAMSDALEIYLGTISTAADLKNAIKPVEDQITALSKLVDDLTKAIPSAEAGKAQINEAAIAAANAVVAKLEDSVRKALEGGKAATESAGPTGLCPANTILSHGFQVMGPEGMIPFDPQKRLIMAMHASAEPLIDTLQQYAKRMLKDKPNQAEQLLPLVRESFRVADGQRALANEQALLAESPERPIEAIAGSLLAAFDPDGTATRAKEDGQ